jgi:hypothetical protein
MCCCSHHSLFEHYPLMKQIRFLRLTGDPTVGDCPPSFLHTRQAQGSGKIFIGVVTSVSNRPFGWQHADAIPFLDGFDRDADSFAN